MTYSDNLLKTRLEMVRFYAHHSSMLDVCCATGQHLMGFADEMQTCTGVDFSLPYLQKAYEDKNTKGLENTCYACSDVRRMPFRSNSFDVAYSFSSLYVIQGVDDVISEIARVLKPGGKGILDLGNLYSLNVIVINAYHKELGWAQHYAISVPAMKRMIHQAGMRIVEHRAFQILPLWGGDRPSWLGMFLAPFWTKLLTREVGGKILDEWISNLPVFKQFAFRHIFVCEKR
jgi:ubiquinone/menaquinone biosynthesis C-methylase UbiE